MQSILFFKSTDDGPIDRMINIDLVSTAFQDPDNPTGTIVYCGNAAIKLGMSITQFIEKVEYLIAENYRISAESNVKWHEKRMADTERVMKAAMKDAHHDH